MIVQSSLDDTVLYTREGGTWAGHAYHRNPGVPVMGFGDYYYKGICFRVREFAAVFAERAALVCELAGHQWRLWPDQERRAAVTWLGPLWRRFSLSSGGPSESLTFLYWARVDPGEMGGDILEMIAECSEARVAEDLWHRLTP